jgi:hypothetical protein
MLLSNGLNNQVGPTLSYLKTHSWPSILIHSLTFSAKKQNFLLVLSLTLTPSNNNKKPQDPMIHHTIMKIRKLLKFLPTSFSLSRGKNIIISSFNNFIQHHMQASNHVP